MITKSKFADWFFFTSLDADNLINTATAARILEVKTPYIYQLYKQGKITRYIYKEGKKEYAYYSYKQIMFLAVCKANENILSLSGIPSKIKWEWFDEMKKYPSQDPKEFYERKIKEYKGPMEKAKIVYSKDFDEEKTLRIKSI